MATSIFRENFPGVSVLQQAVDTASFIIGLDIHAKTTAVCIVDPSVPDAPVFQRKRLPNAELIALLGRFPGKKVIACEAAFGWHLLEDAVASLPDITFVPLDARKTSAWIHSSGIKNDAIDAEVLCHVCLCGGIRSLAVYRQSVAAREASMLARTRDRLVRHRTALLYQRKAFDRAYGPNPFSGEIREKSMVASLLERELDAAGESLEKRIAECEALMKTLSEKDSVHALLQTIPGIGPITAFALRWKMDTIERFKDASHLSAYFGFGVRERQSGETLVKGKIAKTGDPLLRKLLIQGAHVVRSRHPEIVSWYFPSFGPSGMEDRKHRNTVVTALARKNCTFVYYVWKNGVAFDLEKYKAKRLASSKVSASIPSSPMCPSIVAAELELPLVR